MVADGGLQNAAIDVEGLNEAQWNDILATDQVVSVDPISQPATGSRPRPKEKRSKYHCGWGARKRGRPPGPPKFNVRFLSPRIPASWI